MSDRDELAKIIQHEYIRAIDRKRTGDAYTAPADAILAAGYRKPRQVTTVEELDKLGFHAVVLDAYGTPYVCERHRTDGTRNEWQPAGMNHMEESENILYHGPATVLHVGGAA